MRFPPGLLDEIRARLPVSEVVGKRVRLHKAGREWKGLSPFNAEQSPSFFVNDQKGFYHDFSSGKHGDIFAFVMETEGLTFPEAVERLAGIAGVTLPQLSSEAEQRRSGRPSLLDVMALAAAFFQASCRAAGAEGARLFRGPRPWRPTSASASASATPRRTFALRDHLAGKGVTVEAMIEAGLLVHGDDIAVPYDRFRDRLMFPICDVRGPRHRVRRTGAGGGRPGQIPEFAPRRRSSTRARCSTTTTTPASPRTTRAP